MAGKSNKGRNRKGSHGVANTSDQVVSSNASLKDNKSPLESTKVDANGVVAEGESTAAQPEIKESETANSASETKQGEISCVNI